MKSKVDPAYPLIVRRLSTGDRRLVTPKGDRTSDKIVQGSESRWRQGDPGNRLCRYRVRDGL